MLVSGPANTISLRYRPELNAWTQPWFEQDWQLFGPNPQSANTRILVRTRDRNGVIGSWIDLTAIDYAAIEHDPMPSQGNQNELRRALQEYQDLAPTSALGLSVQQYLVNFALQRLAPADSGNGSSPLSGIEFKVETVPIPAPGSTSPVSTNAQELPWWTITSQSAGTA
jgi:hypothetical protein